VTSIALKERDQPVAQAAGSDHAIATEEPELSLPDSVGREVDTGLESFDMRKESVGVLQSELHPLISCVLELTRHISEPVGRASVHANQLARFAQLKPPNKTMTDRAIAGAVS
jgi:hypothetical protein